MFILNVKFPFLCDDLKRKEILSFRYIRIPVRKPNKCGNKITNTGKKKYWIHLFLYFYFRIEGILFAFYQAYAN